MLSHDLSILIVSEFISVFPLCFICLVQAGTDLFKKASVSERQTDTGRGRECEIRGCSASGLNGHIRLLDLLGVLSQDVTFVTLI